MVSNDEKSSQCDDGIMTAETTNPINKSSKHVNASTHVNTDNVSDAQQKESRLDVDAAVPLLKLKSLSPAMKTKKRNKRSDKMCKFFAKGRCKWGATCRFGHINDATNVGEKENKTQKSDEGVSEGTRSNTAISSATIITCSSEVMPTLQKEIPATSSILTAVNLLHDQSVILAGKTTVISNDEKAPECNGILTVENTNPVNETGKEVNASDRVLHSEEQTTLVNTRDVNDAQQQESRLDVGVSLIRQLPPAMEIKEGNKRRARMCKFFANGQCKRGTSCSFAHINGTTSSLSKKRKVDTGLVCPDKLPDASVKDPDRLTDASVKDRDQRTPSPPATSNGTRPDPLTTCEIQSSRHVTEMHVSDAMHIKDTINVGNKLQDTQKTIIISNDGGILTAENTNPVNESGKQSNASDIVPQYDEQNTQANTKDVNDAQRVESRLDVDVLLIRPRSLSPATEIKEGNKHPAFMCVGESTRSSPAISAETIITCSSEIMPTSPKENPATNFSLNDMDKHNPPVNAVNSLHDQSVILAGKTTIISNDEKSPQCDGEIMTAETTNPVNESSKQVNVSDKVPHSVEQTTLANTKDVNDAQQTEHRLDVDVPLIKDKSLSPAMEIKEGNKRQARMCKFFASGRCKDGTSCRFGHIDDTTDSCSKKRKVDCPDKLSDASVKDPNKLTDASFKDPNKLTDASFKDPNKLTDASVKDRDQRPPSPPATTSSKKRKNRSQSRKPVFSASVVGAGTDPWTTNEMVHHTVPPGVIWTNRQAPGMHVSDRAGWPMVPPMASVSPLINYHFSEAYRMVAEKEAEHKREVGDLVKMLERAYKENDRLQRENVQMVNRLQGVQGEMNRVGELERKALALVGELERKALVSESGKETVHDHLASVEEDMNACD